MNIKSILVVTDLSARENIAVQRAWQLADTHRASVKLMYVPPRGQKVAPAAASRLANAARQLEESLQLRVRTAPIQSGKLEDLVAQAQGADLVVLPHRHERSTAAFFRGQPVLRLLRRFKRPVLVVRQARGARYERVLVAVDFSEASESLVKLAASFDASAELEIFHAISTLDESKLRSAADLVVLGKKRSTAWEDFFCGSVAHRVLSWGTSDVLVVPDAYLQATAPHAARRVGTAIGRNTALPLHAAARRMS